MGNRQNAIIVLLFGLLAGISAWLEFGLLSGPANGIAATDNNEPDYYIENFVSTGMHRPGKKYRVIADRLEHYPVAGRALLHRPHIIQYLPPGPPRHIYADSGWLYNAESEVLLSGNVRVIENHSGAAGAAVIGTKKMLIRLKPH